MNKQKKAPAKGSIESFLSRVPSQKKPSPASSSPTSAPKAPPPPQPMSRSSSLTKGKPPAVSGSVLKPSRAALEERLEAKESGKQSRRKSEGSKAAKVVKHAWSCEICGTKNTTSAGIGLQSCKTCGHLNEFNHADTPAPASKTPTLKSRKRTKPDPQNAVALKPTKGRLKKTPQQDSEAPITWICDNCVVKNEQTRKASRVYHCRACDHIYIEGFDHSDSDSEVDQRTGPLASRTASNRSTSASAKTHLARHSDRWDRPCLIQSILPLLFDGGGSTFRSHSQSGPR